MRFIDFDSGCDAVSLRVEHTDAPSPKDNEVLIQVAAFGVNRADTLQRQGKYPAPPGESDILGLEVSGTVMRCGSKVERWQEGDKVFGLVPGGGYAEQVCVDQRHLMAVPNGMQLHHAAGLAEVYLTAFQSLCWLGHIAPGHRVLIHAGASGVGLAGIQLARAMGAEVAVTASSAEKLALCEHVGASLLINYKEQCFKEIVKTQWGASVNMVLDFVGADYLNRNLSLLALDGCVVYLAMLGGRYADKLDMAMLLAKRASIIGSTLRNRHDDYKAKLIAEFSHDWLPKFSHGELSVNIDTVLTIDDIHVAHERVERNDTQGKIIVTWS